MNVSEHPFWLALTVLCLLWYSVITLYVAFRGAIDIRHMLEILDHARKTAAREHPERAAAGDDEPFQN